MGVVCDVLTSCKKCIFYQCECGHIQYNLCCDCCRHLVSCHIERCIFCTKEENNDAIDFTSFLPLN